MWIETKHRSLYFEWNVSMLVVCINFEFEVWGINPAFHGFRFRVALILVPSTVRPAKKGKKEGLECPRFSQGSTQFSTESPSFSSRIFRLGSLDMSKPDELVGWGKIGMLQQRFFLTNCWLRWFDLWNESKQLSIVLGIIRLIVWNLQFFCGFGNSL